MRTSRWFLIIIVLMLVLSSVQPASAATYPNSITALGDSITTAYDSTVLGNNFVNSWSTGTNPLVNSMYLRIFALNLNIQGHATNLAVSGTKMVDLKGQASQVGRRVEYVTILMGANDVCTSSVATMTAVSTFRSQFSAAMQALNKRAPKAKVYVLSIPDIYNLWYILKDNGSARSTWA